MNGAQVTLVTCVNTHVCCKRSHLFFGHERPVSVSFFLKHIRVSRAARGAVYVSISNYNVNADVFVTFVERNYTLRDTGDEANLVFTYSC